MALIGPIGFTGGLNRTSTLTNVGKDQLLFMRNFNIVYNKLQRVQGTRILNSDQANGDFAGGINALVQWRDTTSGLSYIIIEGANISSVEKTRYINSYSSLPASSSSISTAALGTIHSFPSFASLNSLLIRVNDSDTTGKWAPASNWAALGGTPPSGHVCAVAGNYLFIGNTGTSNVSKLQWSNPGDPETWDSGNVSNFNKQDGDGIEGLAEFGGNLLIMKNNSFGLLNISNPSTIGTATVFSPLITIRRGVGLCWKEAWDYINNTTIAFVGTDSHVYIFDGANFTDISNQPFPSSNVQYALNIANGLTGKGIAVTKPILRYYPTRNQLWVMQGNGGPVHWVYNFSLGVWETEFDYFNPYAAIAYRTLGSEAGLSNQISMVSNGAFDIGTLYEHDYNLSTSTVNSQACVSVDLYQGSGFFKPVSVLIPFDASTNALSPVTETVNVKYQYNNSVDITSSSFSTTISVPSATTALYLGRASIVSSVNNIYSIQFNLSNTGANPYITNINPFYLSDQVLV